MHFAGAEPCPCWTCEHYGGMQDNGVTSWCTHPRLSPVVGQPEYGCAFWVRAIGADDEPGAQATPRE